MKIGILALQGAFIEHRDILAKLGVESKEIRQLADFTQDLDGLILPGGESTVIRKLLHDLGLFQPIKSAIEYGLPVFGTCAGMILLADKIVNDGETSQSVCFGTMQMTVRRNAYGRQLGSFETTAPCGPLGNFPMVFIRAPYIESVGDKVEVLSTVDGHIVAVKQGKQLATAFHPELTKDKRLHAYFINMIRS